MSPKYLALSAWGILTPFRITDGHIFLRVVKATCTDFAPLTLILHFFSYIWMWNRLFCKRWDASTWSLWVVRLYCLHKLRLWYPMQLKDQCRYMKIINCAIIFICDSHQILQIGEIISASRSDGDCGKFKRMESADADRAKQDRRHKSTNVLDPFAVKRNHIQAFSRE